jgi:hypothetical protein
MLCCIVSWRNPGSHSNMANAHIQLSAFHDTTFGADAHPVTKSSFQILLSGAMHPADMRHGTMASTAQNTWLPTASFIILHQDPCSHRVPGWPSGPVDLLGAACC